MKILIMAIITITVISCTTKAKDEQLLQTEKVIIDAVAVDEDGSETISGMSIVSVPL